MNKLFHRDVWFPGRIKRQLNQLTGTRALEYSHHARNACFDDRYGNIPILSFVNLDQLNVFEVEEDNKKIVKFVGRISLQDGRDIVMAIHPDKGSLFVRTCWINENTDQHKTLRKNHYEQEPRR